MKKQFVSVLINFFKILLAAVLLLTLFLNVFTLWAIGEIKRGKAVNFGYFCAIVGSRSMEPTISKNDLLLIQNDHSYYAEDIVTYVSPQGSLVTHRVKEVSNQGYITKGDANNVPDEEISGHNRVLGRVVFVLPGVGGIVDGMTSPIEVALFAGIVLLVNLIKRVRSGQKQQAQEKEKPQALLTARSAIKLILKKQKIISIFLLLIFFVFSIGTTQETLGRYLKTLMAADSAPVARFDVIITAPEEFKSEQGENFLEHYFISNTDVKAFALQVYNNGEADVLCIPHLSSDTSYRIYVSEMECAEFLVKTKETVDFWLIVGADGLDTNVKEAKFFVDIRQVEGG